MTRMHPQRASLHNEIHARPPEPLEAPQAVTHMVMLATDEERRASRNHLSALLRDHHQPSPDEGTTHLRAQLGSVRLRWELHTEFVSWTFSRSLGNDAFNPADPPTGLRGVSQDWVATLPGQQLAAIHLWILPGAVGEPAARQLLNPDMVVGSRPLHGQLGALTDFALHGDGFSRMLLLTREGEPVSPRAIGRVAQQLLEIETYRMAGLLGLPVARSTAAALGTAERELAALAAAIREAGRDEEPQLLDRLTRMAGDVESRYAATHARFSASAAYFELVDQRIREIGESPEPGLQTIAEFIERRLSPARSTCAWVARREEALSGRIARASDLLRTRVEIEQQEGTQAVLGAMDRRMGLQLKMQRTVEGLSVAAITYYLTGLVAYMAKGAHSLGWPFGADVTAAAAVPLIALTVWAALRRMQAEVFQDGH